MVVSCFSVKVHRVLHYRLALLRAPGSPAVAHGLCIRYIQFKHSTQPQTMPSLSAHCLHRHLSLQLRLTARVAEQRAFCAVSFYHSPFFTHTHTHNLNHTNYVFLSPSVCLSVCLSVFPFFFSITRAHARAYAQAHTHTHIHTHIHARTHTCTHIHTH